jgi:hypothetical protein
MERIACIELPLMKAVKQKPMEKTIPEITELARLCADADLPRG